MDLKYQLAPPEHARRLKELGMEQESLYYYSGKEILIKTRTGFTTLGKEVTDESPPGETDATHPPEAAFSVAELGAALPASINGVALNMENGEKMKYVSYPGIKTSFGRTEAQARANMLIWLIENNYCSAREINERLEQQE